MSNVVKRSNAVMAVLTTIFAVVGGCAGPTTSGRMANNAKPSVDLPHNVSFTGVQDVFGRNAIGDAIVITAVHGTAPTIAIGNTYRIDGAYTLESHDSADLTAELTGSADAPHRARVPGQSVRIQRGSGTFTVYLKVEDPGCPHVSFYSTTSSFAGEYFGTGGSIAPAHWQAKSEVASR